MNEALQEMIDSLQKQIEEQYMILQKDIQICTQSIQYAQEMVKNPDITPAQLGSIAKKVDGLQFKDGLKQVISNIESDINPEYAKYGPLNEFNNMCKSVRAEIKTKEKSLGLMDKGRFFANYASPGDVSSIISDQKVQEFKIASEAMSKIPDQLNKLFQVEKQLLLFKQQQKQEEQQQKQNQSKQQAQQPINQHIADQQEKQQSEQRMSVSQKNNHPEAENKSAIDQSAQHASQILSPQPISTAQQSPQIEEKRLEQQQSTEQTQRERSLKSKFQNEAIGNLAVQVIRDAKKLDDELEKSINIAEQRSRTQAVLNKLTRIIIALCKVLGINISASQIRGENQSNRSNSQHQL